MVKNMRYRYLMLCGLLASCFFINACATIMTISAPPLSEVALDEERTSGRQVSANYQLIEGTKEFTLVRQPYCMETAKEKIVIKKRIHGVIPAIIEVPLFGLGLVDIVIASQYSKNSVKEEEGQVVETGSIIECGEFLPAGNTELVIQCVETGETASVTTDSSGGIAADKIFAGFLKHSQLNILVKDDRCFPYISTLDSYIN